MKTLASIAIALALVSGSRTARADQLAQVVAVLAAEELPAGLGVVEVHLAPAQARLEVAPERVSVVWPQVPRAGRSSARVVIDGAPAKKLWVPITIATFATVSVATRDLVPGDVIGAADVRREGRPAQRGAATLELVGTRVTARIAAGAVIATAAIEQAPPVARGTEVTVRVRGGGMTVTAHGTLERAAQPGAAATVRLASHALVHGVLVDAATVELPGVTR